MVNFNYPADQCICIDPDGVKLHRINAIEHHISKLRERWAWLHNPDIPFSVGSDIIDVFLRMPTDFIVDNSPLNGHFNWINHAWRNAYGP